MKAAKHTSADRIVRISAILAMEAQKEIRNQSTYEEESNQAQRVPIQFETGQAQSIGINSLAFAIS